MGRFPLYLAPPRSYPYKFGLRLLRILPKLQADVRVFPEVPVDFDPLTDFASQAFDDVWIDAGLPECIDYIRANRSLQIPHDFAPHVP